MGAAVVASSAKITKPSCVASEPMMNESARATAKERTDASLPAGVLGQVSDMEADMSSTRTRSIAASHAGGGGAGDGDGGGAGTFQLTAKLAQTASP